MRKLLLIVLLATAVNGAVIAGIDLSDFNDDVMRAMDDAIKDLEPSLGAGNAEAAGNDIEVLTEAYQWTADYFTHKGGTDDAVKIARQGRALVGEIEKAIATKDLDAAAKLARDTAKNCKLCHDAYKPLTK